MASGFPGVPRPSPLPPRTPLSARTRDGRDAFWNGRERAKGREGGRTGWEPSILVDETDRHPPDDESSSFTDLIAMRLAAERRVLVKAPLSGGRPSASRPHEGGGLRAQATNDTTPALGFFLRDATPNVVNPPHGQGARGDSGANPELPGSTGQVLRDNKDDLTVSVDNIEAT